MACFARYRDFLEPLHLADMPAALSQAANSTLGRRTYWLLLAFLLGLFLFQLGNAPLFDVDEGAFSEATREMFARRDFLFTYLNDLPRFDKPILVYWLQAAAVAVFGIQEWAFRLPSALSAVLWCLAAAAFAAPRMGRDSALLACAMLATSLGIHIIGRASTADALLNLLLVLTLFDIWRYLENGARIHLRRSYLWMALGVLTKGPIAILIPLATSLLYCLSSRRWRDWIKAAFDLQGWLIFLLVALPWYVFAYLRFGQDFIDGFLLKHNIERFSGALEGHSGSIFYYLLIVPLLLMPWLGYLVACLRQIVRDQTQALHRFLWLWLGFVIVFFSFSGTKLPHYALYGCTPLCLLMAAHRERIKHSLLAGLPALTLIGLWIALPFAVRYAIANHRIRDAYYLQLLSRYDIASYAYFLPLACALLVGGGFLLLSKRPMWQRASMLATIHIVLMAGIVTPYIGELLQGPVKRAGIFARRYSEEIVAWNFYAPSFSVYRQRTTHSRPPQPGELALSRADRLPKDAAVDILYQDAGILLVRRRP